jgi:hypothetical protein
MAAVFVFRAFFIFFFTANADLLGDEAYYWDWGRRLDWGYFSKPPMIGWLMGLISAVSPNDEVGIRFAALILGTGTTLWLFLLARRIYDARTAFLAVGLILLTPGNAALNLFLTIDALLLFTWSLGLLLFWLAAEKPGCWMRWLALGLTIGIGTLSKQMMLVLPLLLIVFAVTSAPDRHLLKNPRLWLSLLLGLAFLTPVLWWNQQHQWITLEHTKHHFDAESALSLGKRAGRFLEFPAVQALVYSPVTFAALITVLFLSVRRLRQLRRQERLLLLCSTPPLFVFILLSLRQHINPNWPAVYYLPLFILVAAWWQGHLPFTAHSRWRSWSVRAGLGISAAAYVVIAAIVGPNPAFWESAITTVEKMSPKAGQRLEKTVSKLGDIKGWSSAGPQAGAYLAQVPRPEDTFVLTVGYRYDAAQLAFHMPQRPRVYRWEASGNVMSQYEVWPGPEERLGDDALIFALGNEEARPLAGVVAKHFERVEALGKVRVKLARDHQRIFDVYLGHNLRTWQAIGINAGTAP